MQAARVEGGEGRVTGGSGDPHERTILPETRVVKGHAVEDVVSNAVVEQPLVHLGHDLEGMGREVRVHHQADQREEPRVGADVEHDVRALGHSREELHREVVLRPRASAVTPVQLLRDHAPIGAQHHEPRPGDSALDLPEGRGRRQAPALPEPGHEPHDPSKQCVWQSEAEDPLHVPLQPVPAALSADLASAVIHLLENLPLTSAARSGQFHCESIWTARCPLAIWCHESGSTAVDGSPAL